MRPLLFMMLMAGLTISGCDDPQALSQDAFAAAVKKCQPIDARYIKGSERDSRPSVELTVANSASTVPDCMAKEFGEARPKQLRINVTAAR